MDAWTAADRQAAFNAEEAAIGALIEAIAPFLFKGQMEQAFTTHPVIVATLADLAMDAALAKHNGTALPDPNVYVQRAIQSLKAGS